MANEKLGKLLEVLVCLGIRLVAIAALCSFALREYDVAIWLLLVAIYLKLD